MKGGTMARPAAPAELIEDAALQSRLWRWTAPLLPAAAPELVLAAAE